MAHAFDTSLAAPQRTVILDGALALLDRLLIANGGYLASVAPFGAVVRSATDEVGVTMLKTALQGQLPAVAVALGTRTTKPAGTGGFTYTSDIELLVYFASNNLRDPARGRLAIDAVGAAADSADPGLHVMMEHVEELLVGQRCGASATIKQVRPDREEELTTLDDMTLWLQTYQVTVTRTIDRNRGLVTKLVGIDTVIRPSDQPAASPASTSFKTELVE